MAALIKSQWPVPGCATSALFSGLLTLPLHAVWSDGRRREEPVCLSQALPESANKTCPPLGTTAHLVASLLAWPAWPPAVHAAAPPFGPILSVPSDCSSPAACFGARFFLCGLQAHPQGSGWNFSPWPHPTSLVAGPLVSALPILTSLPKANIREGRAVKGCLRPQFTP